MLLLRRMDAHVVYVMCRCLLNVVDPLLASCTRYFIRKYDDLLEQITAGKGTYGLGPPSCGTLAHDKQ